MLDFVASRWQQIGFDAYQHLSLVVQCLLLATVVGIGLAALVYRRPPLSAVANLFSAVGLTIPGLALIGLVVGPFGFGVAPAVVVVTFYAVLPILRNAVVGLSGVDPSLVEASRGIGMSRRAVFWRVELPLAWPVILSGIRVSAQMVMGIAVVAAFVLGPGLGGLIFSGLARLGGQGDVESVFTGVVAVVLLALLLDLVLVGIGRLTTSKGIRV